MCGQVCSPCAEGTISVYGSLSGSCSTCPVGTVPNSESSSCVACAPGTFAAGGDSICSACPAGTGSTFAAGTCNVCSVGIVCSPCPSGTWSPPFATSCLPCSFGLTSPSGSAVCTLSLVVQVGNAAVISADPGLQNGGAGDDGSGTPASHVRRVKAT